MKKIFALSTTLCVLLFANSVFAASSSFNTGTGSAIWKVADLADPNNDDYQSAVDPTIKYQGTGYLTAAYDDAAIISPPNGAWTKAFGDEAKWIGPTSTSGTNHRQGYTSYMTSGFQFISSDWLKIEFSADNALTNLFVSDGVNVVDLFNYTGTNGNGDSIVDITYNAGNYTAPVYGETSPYGGQGLFQGVGTMMIDWNALMADLNMDASGFFDLYFITQNTNPSNAVSPTAFIASLAGATPASATPEPATLAIMGLGFLGAGIAARRRNKK